MSHPRRPATLIGFGAILLWSGLAALTVASAPVPPFLLSAMCFGIGGILGLVALAARGALDQLRQISPFAAFVSTLGLFGYHALYFAALRLAPPAAAGLVAYLWPLLIVLMAGLLPGEKLRARHLIGAIIAFLGAILIMGQGLNTSPGAYPRAPLGLLLALIAAFVWSAYSVGSRRIAAVPSGAVALTCLASAGLSLIAHVLTGEPRFWPDATGWLAVLALGIGPVGAAFYMWDRGMKHGDIQILGVASYSAPLLSTLLLVVLGLTPATPVLALSAVLITLGALIAARKPR